MPRPGDANGSRVRPNPDWVVVVPRAVRSQVLCLWDQSVPFSQAAAFGVQAMGLSFPSHV